jgi:3-oxoacyl-[acyl-carrier-protein] synthase-3
MAPVRRWYWKEKEGDNNSAGLMAFTAQTHSIEEFDYINMGVSFYPGSNPRIRYLKMKGRKVYEYALKHNVRSNESLYR